MKNWHLCFSLQDVQLVAYNGKRFDFPVLRKQSFENVIQTHGLLELHRMEDPIRRFRDHMGTPKNPKLEEVCAHFGVRVEAGQLHDAMGDSIALMEVMHALENN